MMLLGSSGCAAAGTSAAVHRAAPTGATTLRLWYGSDDPTEGAWVQGLVHAFQSVHRGVRIALTTYGLDQLNTNMQLALSAGAPPDLVYTTPRGPGLQAYVRAGQLRDLSPDARRYGWAAALRPGLLAAYNHLLSANARDAGRVYAAPYALAAVGVLYNKSLFRMLRLRTPRTLDAFAAILPRVARAGLTPLGFGNADGWVGDDWYLTLVNAGVGPAALASELRLDPHFSFQRPAFRAAAATLQGWAQRGYFTQGFGGLDAQDSVATFFEKHTAMQLISSTQNGQILSLARQTGLDVGVFPFPSAAGRAPVMAQSGYSGWAIPRAARQPALAAAFVDYALSAGTAQVLLAHGLLPARRLAASALRASVPFQRDYIDALAVSAPGIYLDSAPVPNLNATMEANVQLLLQNVETPAFLTRSLQDVYSSGGAHASSTRTDGEF